MSEPFRVQGELKLRPPIEKREESFVPVEITGGWVRAEKGIGGRIVLGWFAPGSIGGTQGKPFDSQGKLKPESLKSEKQIPPLRGRRAPSTTLRAGKLRRERENRPLRSG